MSFNDNPSADSACREFATKNKSHQRSKAGCCGIANEIQSRHRGLEVTRQNWHFSNRFDARTKIFVDEREAVNVGAITRRRYHMLGLDVHGASFGGSKSELDKAVVYFYIGDFMSKHNWNFDDPRRKVPRWSRTQMTAYNLEPDRRGKVAEELRQVTCQSRSESGTQA